MGYFIVFILIIFSALFSGLTLGYFSLNRNDLLRKAKLGDKLAKQVYSVRKNGNLLLCTLLFSNVAVNAALSIYLGSITSGVAAGMIATFLIVIFGEILPQAIFSRYALIIGAKLSWVVKFFIFIFYPITFPVAYTLNKILGDELATIYSKRELIKMIEEHEDNPDSEIDEDEERIIKGALSFSDKKVKSIMTPKKEIVGFSSDHMLNREVLEAIIKSGHSRIPVFKGDTTNIISVLYAKDLIDEITHNRKVGEVARKNVIFVPENKLLDDLLNDFKQTKNHLFVVINKKSEVTGLVTIEDVLEEILGLEIIDEFDENEELEKIAQNGATT